MDDMNFMKYNLGDTITEALNDLGYGMPTRVQERVIPFVLKKNDLIVKAQTGSGKTAAFAIPICELIEWLENKPQVLVLTPTRELAVQVKEEFASIGKLKRIKVAAVYGRHPFSTEKTELKQKTHVVTGTPGRVLDHIRKGSLALNKINCLVIDEADRMLDMGFIEQVETILKELPDERMTLLFSATIPEKVKEIAFHYMRNPIPIEVCENNNTTDLISHSLYITKEEEKYALLQNVTIIENPDSCMIFCGTKDRVDEVYEGLTVLGYRCSKIHGGMEQKDRMRAMQRFKNGEDYYLIATDVAARGIDVENTSLVVNYDIPLDAANYVHRTGRTGRAGQKGKAITFLTPKEIRYLHEIEKLIGFEIQQMSEPFPEQVSECKPAFQAKMNNTPQKKRRKSDQLNQRIMKLRFSGGKNKKLRATNFVWVIANIEGVTAEDIGIINVQETLTYVEILNGKGPLVLEAMKSTRIGGKLLKVSVAKDKDAIYLL